MKSQDIRSKNFMKEKRLSDLKLNKEELKKSIERLNLQLNGITSSITRREEKIKVIDDLIALIKQSGREGSR